MSENDYRTTRDPVDRQRSGIGGTVVWALLAVGIGIVIAVATGLIKVDTTGEIRAPKLAMTEGEIPSVQVETPDIEVGTRKAVVDVPTIEVAKPASDGTARN